MVVFHCKWIVWFWTWSLSLSFHFLFPTHGRGYFRLRGLFKNPESLKIVWSPLSCMQPSLKTEPPWSFEFSIVLQWGREGSQWQGLCKEEKKEKEKGPGAESGEGESESLGYEKHCSVTGFTVNFNWFVGARHCAKCLSCMISLILTHTSCSRCLVSCFTDWHPTVWITCPRLQVTPGLLAAKPLSLRSTALCYHTFSKGESCLLWVFLFSPPAEGHRALVWLLKSPHINRLCLTWVELWDFPKSSDGSCWVSRSPLQISNPVCPTDSKPFCFTHWPLP